MTDKIAEYIKLADAATEGPWEVRGELSQNVFLHKNYHVAAHGWMTHEIPHAQGVADMNLIAASRTLGPAMAKALIEAEAAIIKLTKDNRRDTDDNWGIRSIPSNDACDAAEQALSTIQKLKEMP